MSLHIRYNLGSQFCVSFQFSPLLELLKKIQFRAESLKQFSRVPKKNISYFPCLKDITAIFNYYQASIKNINFHS